MQSFRVNQGHLQQVGLSPKFGSAKTLASFGIPSIKEVVEEVTAISLFAQLGAFGKLTFAIGHVSSSTSSEAREEDLVELEPIHDGHGSALYSVSYLKFMCSRGLTYNEMSGCRSFDKAQGEPVVFTLQHVESLSKAQVSKNIHSKVITPVGHISGAGPSLGLNAGIFTTNLLGESTNISEDISLHLLHCTIREGMGQNTTLPSMQLFVTSVMGVGSGMDKGIVELGLADIGFESVDLLQGRVRVDADGVGAKADNLAILLVHPPEF